MIAEDEVTRAGPSRTPAGSKTHRPEDNQMTHEKLKSRATMSGQFFEVKMSALLYLRGANSGRHFQLATNVVGAGALDDVVFKFKTSESPQVWNTCFIQLKHKAKAQLRRTMLLEKGDFALRKYLNSFVEIKEAMLELTERVIFDGSFTSASFIIFTNASLHRDLLNSERFVESSPGDEYVQTGVESENIISFTQEDDEDIYSALGTEGEEFLKKLRLFTGEPREDQLDDIIKVELRKYCKSKGAEYFDGIYTEYEKEFKRWWAASEGIILDQKSTILQQAIQQSKVAFLDQEQKKRHSLNIKFLDSATAGIKESLTDQHSLVNIVADDSVRLASTKLLQALDAEKQSFIFVGSECLLDERDAVTSAWRNKHKHLLVVASDATGDGVKLRDVCTELCEVLAENPEKKIVLLSLAGDQMAAILQEMLGEKFSGRSDSCKMSQLNQASISWVLAKPVIFQGQSTDIGSILGTDVHTWTLELNSCLGDIIAGNVITIGGELEEDISYYVPRTMLSKVVVKETVFSDKNFAGKIVIQGATLKVISKFSSHIGQSKSNKLQKVNEEIVFDSYDGTDSDNTRNDIHYLELIDWKLKWKKSQGNINFIKQHVDSNVTDTLQDLDDKVVLLVAEAGMGKTTFMTHLARQHKQKHPNTWVVCLALNDHASLFAKKKEDGFDAVEFLISALGIGKLSALEQALFKYSLNTGNMAVLLDAFDEIAPTYVKKCCALVTSLLKTEVKHVWLTSRPSMQDTLETLTSNLAISLRKFSQEDQEKFLLNYWKQSSNHTEQGLNSFITRILQNTAQSMNDKERDFTGIPLQTHMLAEIFQNKINDSSLDISHQMDVLDLIERFVDQKIELYVQKEYKIDKESVNLEEKIELHRESFIINHQMSSLILLFNEVEVQNLLSKAKVKQSLIFLEKVKNGTDKKGIIDRIVDQKPVFIHRVFAEFFTAQWFAENSAKHTEFILNTLLADTSAVIRNILDLLLSRGYKLHRAVLHADTQQVENLLLMEETDVNAQDEGGRTALHYAVAAGLNSQSNSKTNIEIMDLLLQHGARADIKDDVLQWTPVEFVDPMGLWAEMNSLIKHGWTNITHQPSPLLNINQDLWRCVIEGDFVHIMSRLFDFGLSVDSVFEEDSSTLLHKAAEYGSKDIAALLLNLSESTTDKNNVRDGIANASMATVSRLLFQQNRYGRTPLMEASCQGHKTIVEMMLASFTDDAARAEFVNGRDNDEVPALFWSARYGYNDIVQLLLDAGADVRASDYRGINALMLASREGQKTIVEMLLSSFTDDAARVEYVNRLNNEGISAIFWSAGDGHHDIVQLLLDVSADVTASDNTGISVLMVACTKGHKSIVELLLASFTDDAGREEYVDRRDDDGNSAMWWSSLKGHHDIVQLLLDAGADVTTSHYPDRFALSLACAQSQQTVYDMLLAGFTDVAAKMECAKRLENDGDPAMWCQDYRDIVQLQQTSAEVTPSPNIGWSVLIVACVQGHKRVVEMLLAGFTDGAARTEYANRLDQVGHSAVWWSAMTGHNDIVQLVLDAGATMQESDDLCHAIPRPHTHVVLSQRVTDTRDVIH